MNSEHLLNIALHHTVTVVYNHNTNNPNNHQNINFYVTPMGILSLVPRWSPRTIALYVLKPNTMNVNFGHVSKPTNFRVGTIILIIQ